MKLLIVSATLGEIKYIKHYLDANSVVLPEHEYAIKDTRVKLNISGVGQMATAFSLGLLIAKYEPDFVLNVGIAGSFDTTIALGKVIGIRSEVFGDLGIDNHGIFEDVFESGLIDRNIFPFDNKELINHHTNLPFGNDLNFYRSLTVNTVSGSNDLIKKRIEKYNCQVESMEGAAVHYCCLLSGMPFLQIRSISNYVEPRNRENWNMDLAILNLNNYVIEKVFNHSFKPY